MTLELSQKMAEFINNCVLASCMLEDHAMKKLRQLYMEIPPEEMAKFCHNIQELAYGEKVAQEGAMQGAYNPELFHPLED